MTHNYVITASKSTDYYYEANTQHCHSSASELVPAFPCIKEHKIGWGRVGEHKINCVFAFNIFLAVQLHSPKRNSKYVINSNIVQQVLPLTAFFCQNKTHTFYFPDFQLALLSEGISPRILDLRHCMNKSVFTQLFKPAKIFCKVFL